VLVATSFATYTTFPSPQRVHIRKRTHRSFNYRHLEEVFPRN